MFCLTQDLGARFLTRAYFDRLAGDGGHTNAVEMEEQAVKGLHPINLRDDKGDITKVALEIRYKRRRINLPIGKQKRHPALSLTVIHASQRMPPKGRKRLEWTLMTDLPVRTRAEGSRTSIGTRCVGRSRCSTKC